LNIWGRNSIKNSNFENLPQKFRVVDVISEHFYKVLLVAFMEPEERRSITLT